MEEWMKTNDVPNKLQKRVSNYLDENFKKYKGNNCLEILNILPESVKEEVLFGLFSKFYLFFINLLIMKG